MNNLKKYAGLLNDAAPKGEFLAYINEEEAEILKDNGALGLLTPQGIPSYFVGAERDARAGRGDISPGTDRGGNQRNGSGGNNPFEQQARQRAAKVAADQKAARDRENQQIEAEKKAYQDKIQRISTGIEPGYRSVDSNPFGMSKEDAYRQGKITVDELLSNAELNANNVDERSSFTKGMDSLADFFKTGGLIGATFRGLSNFAENFNKKKRNDFMSTADIKAYELGTGKNWNPNAVTNTQSDEYNYLKNETNYFDQFNSEENRNENNPSSFFDDVKDTTFTNLTTNQNPFSQVNQSFKNMGSNLGVSPAYMNTYNQAKNQMAKSLNLTPNTQQFGYGNTFNDNYARSMTSANPYFEELTNQGLI
jgi:hypothetical protein